MANWKDVLGVVEKLAPGIATIAGTPLAGLALSTVFNALGITPKSTDPEQQKKELADVWTGSQEQLLALRQAENDFRLKMAELGFQPQGGSSDDFAALIPSEMKKWLPIVKATGFQM